MLAEQEKLPSTNGHNTRSDAAIAMASTGQRAAWAQRRDTQRKYGQGPPVRTGVHVGAHSDGKRSASMGFSGRQRAGTQPRQERPTRECRDGDWRAAIAIVR